jgi:hypothetical protein
MPLQPECRNGKCSRSSRRMFTTRTETMEIGSKFRRLLIVHRITLMLIRIFRHLFRAFKIESRLLVGKQENRIAEGVNIL